MFFSRGFPRGVDFFKMELPNFQCYMRSELTFLKTVNFLDFFEITPRFDILLAKYTIIGTQEKNDREGGGGGVTKGLPTSTCVRY